MASTPSSFEVVELGDHAVEVADAVTVAVAEMTVDTPDRTPRETTTARGGLGLVIGPMSGYQNGELTIGWAAISR